MTTKVDARVTSLGNGLTNSGANLQVAIGNNLAFVGGVVNAGGTLGTAVNTTSGTSIDFTGIPSWVNRITMNFSGLSTNGSSNIQIQLGTAASIETTGYLTSSSYISGGVGTANVTTGFGIENGAAAANIVNGSIVITRLSGNTWSATSIVGRSETSTVHLQGGAKTLSDALTRVRMTTINGTDVFDAGITNVFWE